jgi:hypothetical protein
MNEGGCCSGGASLCKGLYEGDLEEGSFTGDPKNMLSKAQKWASASIWAPLLGNMEGCFFLRTFLYRGNFMRFSRDMKIPCQWVSLSIGALLGNLEGVHLAGILRERKIISGFLSWTQKTFRFLVWGASGTLLKEKGSPELILDYGAQRAQL